MINKLLISGRGLRKTYKAEDALSPGVEVLRGLDIDIYSGEAVCIMGSSGAGKSTLLHLLGALDRATAGTVTFRDQNLSRLSDDQLSQFRNKSMGFVFQSHHLLSDFSALENVMMPALIGGLSFYASKKLAEKIL